MTTATVYELLDQAAQLHQRTVDLAANASEVFRTSDPGPNFEPPVDLLYDLLSSAERCLSEAIDGSHGVRVIPGDEIAARLAALGACR